MKIRDIIMEGGKTFRDTEGNILTQPIAREDIMPTVQWLEKITGLDLVGEQRDAGGVPVMWLGSTGRTAMSGDLDFAVVDATKQQVQQRLVDYMNQHNLEPANQWIKAVKQKEINFRAPIAGDPKNGYVQVDFNFYEDPDSAQWAKFYMSGTSAGFKGMHRNVLLSSLAKAQGLKVGANGMIHRDSNEPVPGGKDPDTVAQTLLGPGHSAADLSTVERIYAAVENHPDRDAMLADFGDFLQKQGLSEPGGN